MNVVQEDPPSEERAVYELKEGRGPSFMGGIASLVMVGFAITGVGLCVSLGAPIWFAGFGALFGVLGLVSAVYNFWAASTTNRPDIFDVTTDKEEPDPLNRRRNA
jgi:hypothetical protein